MAKKIEYEIDDETIEILRGGYIKDNIFYLTNASLDRDIYEKVDKVLKCLGAKWSRKYKGHIFQYDIKDELDKAIKEKKVTDWKKATDYFFTPKEVIETMISLLPVAYNEKLSFLEPSCGQGHILDIIQTSFKNSSITCIEKNPLHCNYLKEKGYDPICSDFLEIEPNKKFDIILMNPPFSHELEHIKHAYRFLNKGGYLISVSSGSFLYNTHKKHKDFLEWFREKEGSTYQLLPNSFKESGTNTNTILVCLDKTE